MVPGDEECPPSQEGRESLGEPDFAEDHTPEISCATKLAAQRYFSLSLKTCVTDFQEVFIYSSN